MKMRIDDNMEGGEMKAKETMNAVAAKLEEIEKMIVNIQWTDEEVRDATLGKDLNALNQHLDNAKGRAITIFYSVKF